MIKVLLFDFYGVFLPDAYDDWLKNNNATRDGVFASLILQRDTGVISESNFLNGLSHALDRKVTLDELHQSSPEPNHELIDLVRSLKSHYKIFLFSNASPKLRSKLNDLQINDLFDDIFISSEIGRAKPSDEAFQFVITKIGVKSDEILFVDDRPENIEAALKNEMLTCLYTSLNNLKGTLRLIEPTLASSIATDDSAERGRRIA